MFITRECDYAVRVVRALWGESRLSVSDICEKEAITAPFAYKILKKLQKAGYLTTYSQEYQGRKRKYYSITEEGKAQITYLSNEWKVYKDTVDGIIEGRIRG